MNTNENRKIIFLDVDGVLNIFSPSYRSSDSKHYGLDAIEPHLVRRLEWLLEQTPNSFVVVSSSWGLSSLFETLHKRNFKYHNKIIARTPRNKYHLRGEQINQWLMENEWGSYVVFEDEISDVCGEKCSIIPREFVVEIDSTEGLSHKNIERAINILNL